MNNAQWIQASDVEGPILKSTAIWAGFVLEVSWNYDAHSSEDRLHGWKFMVTNISDIKDTATGFGSDNLGIAKARAIATVNDMLIMDNDPSAVPGLGVGHYVHNSECGCVPLRIVDGALTAVRGRLLKDEPGFAKILDGHWIFNEKDYARAQKQWLKHTGLKVGDEVLVNRLPLDNEGPWSNSWAGVNNPNVPSWFVGQKCEVTSMDSDAIYVLDPVSPDNAIGLPCFVLEKYRYTIDFQRRVATVCNISHGGRRIAKNIALLGSGEKEDNTPRARDITLERALKQLDLPGNLKEILREQAKNAVMDEMPVAAAGLERMCDNWIILNADGRAIPLTSSSTRMEAIEAFNRLYSKKWPHWRRKGFKCIKIESFIRRV